MSDETELGALKDGGHVVVIGGGPGGTACALRLKCLAAQMNRHITVTLVESKQFSGEHHYNQCAGVLSHPLPELMHDKLGVPFPHHLARALIQGYVLHSNRTALELTSSEEDSIALRRVQFDAYMLDQIQQREVQLVQARATDLEFHAGNVIVYTENSSFEADVIVGAFGLDEGSGAMFSRLTGYQPPLSLSSVVTKYHPGPEGMAAFGTYIHAFLPSHPRIEFGAITPKGNHLTINIAGSSVDVNLMHAFLRSSQVQSALPNLNHAGTYDPHDLRYFKGRFPRSTAQCYFGDRYVMVGDAAGLVRAFKGKGVTTAMLTGIRAAETIMEAGISKQAFHRRYQRENRDITSDLPYGRLMRSLAIFMARYKLLDPVVRAARQDPGLRQALFDAVSASAPYREVFERSFRPEAVLATLGAMFHSNST
jgi:flavin-dependent dehydrogenase